jgi:spermidine/putrescine transport system substrate-binding protein
MPERDRDLDLFFEQLVEGRLSRRQVLRRLGAAGLTVSSAGTFLAACGGVKGTDKGAPQAKSVTHAKTAIKELDFSNWPLYIYKKVLKDFEKQHPGSKVKYVEEINDNEEFFGKVRQQLQQGRSLGRDLVVLTDWMASRWIRAGWVEAKDKDNIPNEKNLQPGLRHPKFDPERTFTLPWQSGMTAIGYNPKKTGRKLNSINDLFDPAFKGRVTMLSEPYDSATSALLGMGIDPSTAKIDQLLKGIEKIQQAADGGQFRRFTGNDYSTDLTKGNIWIALAYSGDIVQLQSDNPELEFVYPDEGAMTFTDNMMLPAKAEHVYAAEKMMDFVYEPEIAAKLAIYVNYLSPVNGVKEIVEKTDPDIANNPLIFPPDEIRAKLHPYPALSDTDERTMKEAMAKVTGA